LPSVTTAAAGTTSTSVLSAPTTSGVFSLTQTIAQSPDGTASVSVLPQLATQDGSVTTAGVASSAAVTRDASGTLTVDVAAKDVTTPSSPLGALHVHMVLASNLSKVLTESVVVGTSAPTTTGAPVVAPSPMTTPTTCSNDTVTSAGGTLGTSDQTSPVIGMSPESSDDPQGQCSSTNNGGSVPLLPSPAQP